MSENRIRSAVWVDDLGLRLGLERLENESVSDYRDRLEVHVNNPPSPQKHAVAAQLGRPLGILPKEAIKITLPGFPKIEIDGIHLNIWTDITDDNTKTSFDIYNRESDHYFLGALITALTDQYGNAVTNLAQYNVDGWEYQRSWNLVETSNEHWVQDALVYRSRFNDLEHKNITSIGFDNYLQFKNEVQTYEEIVEEGQYYVDYENGKFWSYNPADTIVSYAYVDTEVRLNWSPVKVTALTKDFLTEVGMDSLVTGVDGTEEKILLNPKGAELVNNLLEAHTLQWGK